MSAHINLIKSVVYSSVLSAQNDTYQAKEYLNGSRVAQNFSFVSPASEHRVDACNLPIAVLAEVCSNSNTVTMAASVYYYACT